MSFAVCRAPADPHAINGGGADKHISFSVLLCSWFSVGFLFCFCLFHCFVCLFVLLVLFVCLFCSFVFDCLFCFVLF